MFKFLTYSVKSHAINNHVFICVCHPLGITWHRLEFMDRKISKCMVLTLPRRPIERFARSGA